VLPVTALKDRDHRLRGLAAGADHFLTKPFDDRLQILALEQGHLAPSIAPIRLPELVAP
jgi:DNA-binding response OmpR family regulator